MFVTLVLFVSLVLPSPARETWVGSWIELGFYPRYKMPASEAFTWGRIEVQARRSDFQDVVSFKFCHWFDFSASLLKACAKKH